MTHDRAFGAHEVRALMTIILPTERDDGEATADQRRDRRYTFRLPVTLLRGREEIPLRTEDVSYQGLFLDTDDPPPLRRLLRLRLLIPPFHRELTTFAMAVHAREGGGVGVQLYALDRAARTVWANFVTRVRFGDFSENIEEFLFLPPDVLPPTDAGPDSAELAREARAREAARARRELF
jgi:hypothetical protein